MRRFLALILFLPSFALAQESLIAADDAYDTLPDSSISISGPGLLLNDALTTSDSLVVILLSGPTSGELRFDGLGGFSYKPAAGFAGIDSFSYELRTIPFQQIELDTTQSTLIFDAEVDIGLASRSDVDSTAMKGVLGFYIQPTTTPFQSVHLQTMDLTINDSLELSIGYSILGNLGIKADKDSLNLFMNSFGDAANITTGAFQQAGNKVGISGILNLSGSGFIGDSVPDEPQVFETETDLVVDGNISLNGSQIEMAIPIAFVDTVALSDDATAYLNLGGSLKGIGPYIEGLTSNTATVYITVEPFSNTASEDLNSLQTILEQNFPNPVSSHTRIGYQLAAASTVSLKVYDTLGREIVTLIDAFESAGTHEVVLDTSAWPPGMYLYQLQTDNYQASRTFVVLH